MNKNILVFISASALLAVLLIAFFLMFGKTSTDIPSNADIQQEEAVKNFDFQGRVTAPITN